MDDPRFLAGLATAIASAVAALIAFYQASRVSKLKAEADKDLERFRKDAELVLERLRMNETKRQRAFEIATKEAEPVIDALVQAWTDLQTMRDLIAKAVAPVQFDQLDAFATLKAAAVNIATGYSRWGSSIPPPAEMAWHSAKNATMTVQMLITERGTSPQPNPDARDGIDDKLLELRDTLRDYQSVIQESISSVRADHMKRILEVMNE